MPPTPDPELNAVLEALITGVRPILGDNFAGAYLQGSFAVGDADAGSDVDFLIVVNRDVPDAQVPALQAVHVRVYDVGSSWAKHLEGSYFPRAWLRDPEATTHPLLYVDNGSRVLERSKHDNTLVVRWVLREHGITLVGPEPGKLLEPVPAGALRREVLTTMQAWAREIFADPKQMNNGWYQPYAVLSYCRMLHTLESGRVVSKPAGSRWATRTLNSRWHGLIQRATEAHAGQWLRVSQRADADDFEATLEFIRYAITVSRQFANRHDIEAPK